MRTSPKPYFSFSSYSTPSKSHLKRWAAFKFPSRPTNGVEKNTNGIVGWRPAVWWKHFTLLAQIRIHIQYKYRPKYKSVVELLTLHYISEHPQQSSDRSVFSLGEPRHAMTRTKRAKRMTDWANVRMIKDGPVLMENENTLKIHHYHHVGNIFSFFLSFWRQWLFYDM